MSSFDGTTGKLSIISGSLFASGGILAISGLSVNNWLYTDIGAKMSLGLIQTCISMQHHEARCEKHVPLHGAWTFTLLCMVCGIVTTALTLAFLIASNWKSEMRRVARWLGFATMVLFCMGTIIYPAGFGLEEIGGEPYQLPSGFKIGFGYIFSFVALCLVVVAEVVAGKVCTPRL